MILLAFSIRDSASDSFGRPFFVPSVGIAIRTFTDEVNREQENNNLFYHPEDFELYQVGSFDDSNGCILRGTFQGDTPELKARGKDVKIRNKKS